jgi:SAM-dependent methyltransferase
MLDSGMVNFVKHALPGPPARVLEVGAGSGELAAYLADSGYDVVAIDPAGRAPHVQAVALADLEAPDSSFDAAVAVLSLHHVEPLGRSCERLASVLRPGAVLVVDEFDMGVLDVEAVRWWLGQRPDVHQHGHDAGAIVADMHDHLHQLSDVRRALEPWFELGDVERVPYLYRWALGPHVRPLEEQAISGGQIAATGARIVGRRR